MLAQTEVDWEAIVVDDGSTDETSDVMQRYGANDPRIHFIQNEGNVGVSHARNHGVKASRGLFITFLDSDDEYLPEHLKSRKAMLLQLDSTMLLHGGVKIIGDPFVIDKDDPKRKIHIHECVVGGTFVIRRDVFDLVGGFDPIRYADDAMFFQRVAEAGLQIVQTDHPTYVYHRDTPDQLTSSYAP